MRDILCAAKLPGEILRDSHGWKCSRQPIRTRPTGRACQEEPCKRLASSFRFSAGADIETSGRGFPLRAHWRQPRKMEADLRQERGDRDGGHSLCVGTIPNGFRRCSVTGLFVTPNHDHEQAQYEVVGRGSDRGRPRPDEDDTHRAQGGTGLSIRSSSVRNTATLGARTRLGV